MARAASLDAGELSEQVAALRAAQPDRVADQDSRDGFLRDLHSLLIRGAPRLDRPPSRVLDDAAAMLAALPDRAEDRLAPRPRTAFRLLRAGVLDACWSVLADNAVGYVRETAQESTSSGAARATWPLPSLTYIDGQRVFADLPGFRDPRYAAPDECYDLSDAVRVRGWVDDLTLTATTIQLGGFAALEHLDPAATERVTLVAEAAASQIAVACRRLRRTQPPSSGPGALLQAAWGGWSAEIEVGDPRLARGSWPLSLAIEHQGLDRRAPLGSPTTALARAALEQPVFAESRSVSIAVRDQQLQLVIAEPS